MTFRHSSKRFKSCWAGCFIFLRKILIRQIKHRYLRKSLGMDSWDRNEHNPGSLIDWWQSHVQHFWTLMSLPWGKVHSDFLSGTTLRLCSVCWFNAVPQQCATLTHLWASGLQVVLAQAADLMCLFNVCVCCLTLLCVFFAHPRKHLSISYMDSDRPIKGVFTANQHLSEAGLSD